jgi:uncharacterized damage-inducible protein DinB
MEWQHVVIGAFKRSTDTLEKALANLSQDDLKEQPNPDSNSIGWIAWHLSRIQDRAISRMAGQEQVWIKGGWYTKFGRAANPEDTGFKHTSQDVAAFKSPDVVTLVGYNRTVVEQTAKFLSTLTVKDLDKKTDHPVFTTLGVWLTAVLTDSIQHSGQIAYLRGLLKGKGWSDV